MSDKIIKIGNHILEMSEYETTAVERSAYGLNVYIVGCIDCDLWEYLMPTSTIREEKYRDVSSLWWDFIYGDKEDLINIFILKLNKETGLNFHLLNENTIPSSVLDFRASIGKNLNNGMVQLILYGNNR